MSRANLQTFSIIGLVLAVVYAARGVSAEEPQRRVQDIFNGMDVSNWHWVTDVEGPKMEDVWSVRDGILYCTGKPTGYIRTKKGDYRDYLLIVEWRWPEKSQGGNNGVLVHASKPKALGVWPKSIEVQLGSRDAGDFWIIGTKLNVPDEATRKTGRCYKNLTDDSEKPIGQWNRMEITCRGDKIVVKVNGQLVNEATNCNVAEGAISLQSEGAPIQFRKVQLVRQRHSGANPLSSGKAQ